MKDKFSCTHTGDCIIPLGLSYKEIEEKRLPHSCLECSYYTMQTKENEIITFAEYERGHLWKFYR